MSFGLPVSRTSARLQPYICLRCQSKRTISTSFLVKKEEGRQQWQQWAKEIRAGERKSMLQILEERGYVQAVAGDRNALERLMIDKRIGAYVGFDPTAASLHVGHLLPLMALFWMHLHGFHTISLLGASTAKIGDPTGRTTSRTPITPTERKANLTSMHYQLKRIWLNLEAIGRKHGYHWEKYWHRDIVNNATWWNKTPFLDILQYLGPGLRMGTMLSKETAKTKLESPDGMSFSEFCYPVLQSWDWWFMYWKRSIQMQIGGADQLGNILAGIDAIKYIAKTHPNQDVKQEGGVTELTAPVGFTVPLLTTSSGEKFGKSAGNAIWLDQEMTSLFDLYGFWLRTADTDVEKYLKLFTFLPLNDIGLIMKQHNEDPTKRVAQHALAREFIELIHGAEDAKRAASQHERLVQRITVSAIFDQAAIERSTEKAKQRAETSPDNPLLHNQNLGKRVRGTYSSPSLNPFAKPTTANDNPSSNIILPRSLVDNQSIGRILYAAGLVTSRSEGHRLALNQGAYIGHRADNRAQMDDQLNFTPAKLQDPNQAWKYVIRDNQFTGDMEKEGEEGLLILRVGKWKVRVVRIVADEKYRAMNIAKPPQAWIEFEAQRAAERSEAALNQTEREQEGKKAGYFDEGVEIDGPRPARKDRRRAFVESQQQGMDYLRRGPVPTTQRVIDDDDVVWDFDAKGRLQRTAAASDARQSLMYKAKKSEGREERRRVLAGLPSLEEEREGRRPAQ